MEFQEADATVGKRDDTNESAPVLAYANGQPAKDYSRFTGLAYAVGIATFIVPGLCGVGSDSVQLSLPKKIAFSIVSLIALYLLGATALKGSHVRYWTLFPLVLLNLFVMWFMN